MTARVHVSEFLGYFGDVQTLSVTLTALVVGVIVVYVACRLAGEGGQ